MKKNLYQTIMVVAMLFMTVVANAATTKIYNNIVVDNRTSEKSITYAIKALSDDFNRKFGTKDPLDSRKSITLSFEISSEIEGFDKYEIDIKDRNISFKGSDELGLIHAIYTFSQDKLGIDPFIHFTLLMPDMVEELDMKCEKIVSKPYSYTHRGFFINDEDLIAGFQLEKIEYGFNLDFMERVFETMLRAKMTGVIPSTLVLSDEPHLTLASDMGLYIMQHHAEPIGSVPLYWPKNEPYSWNTNKEAFVKFWSEAIERQKGKNVIWTLGFRGLLDRDFWDDDPTLTKESSDEKKAAVINEAIAMQYKLIKEITGNPEPLVTANMRGYISTLFNKGLIKYPAQTMIQFTDNGYGAFQGTTWKSCLECKYPMGVYQHVSYHSKKSHMRVNVINPNMMCKEMTKAYDNNLTSICVLNVGNIKEKVFGIQQVVNYMNDFETYRNQSNNEYYSWYVNDKYRINSPTIARVYQDYFNNLYSPNGGRGIGDEAFANYAEILLKMAYTNCADLTPLLGDMPGNWKEKVEKKESGKEKMAEATKLFVESLESSISRWDVSMQRAYDAQSELSGNRLNFYQVDAMLPTKKMYHLTSMLSELFKSVDSYMKGKYNDAQAYSYKAISHMDGALEVEKLIEEAHAGEFKDWYRYDQTARTKITRDLISNFHKVCIDMKQFYLPYGYKNPKTLSIQYKKQPFFDSKYNGELHYMELAD